MTETKQHTHNDLTAAEIGALAHLYRGEIYRSTIWRTRLDTTTNWSVVSLGVALSISFASPEASPLPLLIIGILIWLFMILEARRYRYFNVWRARARWMERCFYAPMLHHEDYQNNCNWQNILANDYLKPEYHVSYVTAMGRRVRRNYLWILIIQTIAYLGKLIIHPTSASSVEIFIERASVGPIPGEIILFGGLLYVSCFVMLSHYVSRKDAVNAKLRSAGDALG
ncbi:DUF2270 domain-containing protein [Ruegeria lacuscaerulensis]|uniref:DUF2270 domain-containing protein n=1 Tax=Ruegeria lacuscaerulensis TaxID=55218 RepID=UPI0014808364|nr:DUF2270 domain-containing protein [Ruegeria lacuscaerulensis]